MQNTLERIKSKLYKSSSSSEISNTNETIESQLQSPDLATQLRGCRQLMELLLTNNYTENQLGSYWYFISSLGASETKIHVLEFMKRCIVYHYSKMGPILRLEFYHYLNACADSELADHLEILILLTREARDVKGFENEIGDCLSSWLDRISRMKDNTESMNVILSFIVSLFKFSFLYFSQQQVSTLLQCVGSILSLESSNPSIKEQCLLIYDTTIKYGQVGVESLELLLVNLCLLHQEPQFSQFVYSIAFNILSSHRARESVKILVLFLRKHQEKQELILGSCFFLYTFHWGESYIPTLYTSTHYLLDNFLGLVKSSGSKRVQIQSLVSVKAYFEFQKTKNLSLSILEWDMVVEMVRHTIHYWVSDCPKEIQLTLISPKEVELDSILDLLYYFILQIRESFDFLVPGSQYIFLSSILTCILPWLDQDGLNFVVDSNHLNPKSLLSLALQYPHRHALVTLVIQELKRQEFISIDLLDLLDLLDNESILNQVLELILQCVISHSPVSNTEFIQAFLDKLIHLTSSDSQDYKRSIGVKGMIQLWEITCMDSEKSLQSLTCLTECISALNNPLLVIQSRMELVKFLTGLRIVNGICTSCLVFSTNTFIQCLGIDIHSPSTTQVFSLYLQQLTLFLTKETQWDVYVYLLSLLSEQVLHFYTLDCGPFYMDLGFRVLELLNSETLGETLGLTNIPSSAKISDLYPLLYRLLSRLLESYKILFTKKHLDDAMSVFMNGLSRPNVSKSCLHSLTLALYEYEASMIKFLPSLLIKLSQMTFMSFGIPNLEFLSHLARVPLLHSNLTESDYKRVFGIAIQYIRGLDRGNQTESPQSNYITYLAYHVLSVWFLSLPMPERRNYVVFISKQLVSSDLGLDVNGEVVLDMLALHTYSDVEPRAPFTPCPQAKHWLIGNCVLSIQKAVEYSGWSLVIVRRPSGTVVFWNRLENVEHGPLDLIAPLSFLALKAPTLPLTLPVTRSSVGERKSMHHQRSVSSGSLVIPLECVSTPQSSTITPSLPIDTPKRQRSATISHPNDSSPVSSFDSSFHPPDSLDNKPSSSPSATPVVDPAFLLCQMGCFPNPYLKDASSLPVLLANDESLTRALSVLDKTPVLDLHKVGVLYVGKGQSTESSILSNTCGSKAYNDFLKSLGAYFRLEKSKNIYSGGLDTSPECIDGVYALAHVERLCQCVFHVTTLMPTLQGDLDQLTFKKRHIGNDFVNIIWNESGLEYEQSTIEGQFNYIAIVITPSLFPLLNGSTSSLKVHVLHKPELVLPAPFVEPRFVLQSCLGPLIRTLAIHFNIYCQIWTSNTWTTSAKERLNQISRIRERSRWNNVDDMNDFTRYL